MEVGPRAVHLCVLEEVLVDEPPVRLHARFYEPGAPAKVAAAVLALGDAVVAIGAPAGGSGERAADAELRELGVAPAPPSDAGKTVWTALAGSGVHRPEAQGRQGEVEDGAFQSGPVFETNIEGVFCALHEQRVPARRHPLGVARRIEELEEDHVEDSEPGLWARRIEEIEAAAAALCAHRFAVGHARWLGDPEEGVIVLPGSGPLGRFSTDGVVPAVERLPLR